MELDKLQTLLYDFFGKEREDTYTTKLLANPFTKGITQDENGTFYVESKLILNPDDIKLGWHFEKYKSGGLWPRLARNFFPFHEAVCRRSGTSSKEVGIRVHRQIYHVIHCIGYEKFKIGDYQIIECNCVVKTNPKRLNKLTLQAFEKMDSLGITPEDAEVPIYCNGGFCTKLDVVGYRWKGTRRQTSTIISIKTGYTIGYDRDSRGSVFYEPFEDLKCTSKNKNQLQALAELCILKYDYGMTFEDYFIFYLGKVQDDDGNAECLVEPLELGKDDHLKLMFYTALCRTEYEQKHQEDQKFQDSNTKKK